MSSRLLSISILFLLFTSTSLFAQKKKLEPEDYGPWQQITTTQLSPDGSWFAYNIDLVDGDGWLTLKKAGSDSTGEHTFMHGVQPAFSENSQWAAFRIGVSEKEQKKLEKQSEPVRYKLGLMNLSTAQVDTLANISDFEFSDDSRFLAMEKYKAKEVKTEGHDLILRNLKTGANQLIGNVAEYAFNDSGQFLAVLTDATEKLGNGVQLYEPAKNTVQVLDSDTTAYSDLEWDKYGSSLSFLKARPDTSYEEDTHLVYAFRDLAGDSEKMIFDQRSATAFPDSFRVVDYRAPYWSEDGKRLFFGIKKWEKKEEASADSTREKHEEAKADSAKTDSTDTKNLDEDLDPTNVEVWHWKDAQIQPRQELLASIKQESNFMSAWHLDGNKFVQLSDEKLEDVILTGDQRHAMGFDAKPYEPAFEEDWEDVYIVDVETGVRKKILSRQETVRSSPEGNYLIYYRDQNWWTYDIKDEKHINLTENVDTRFEDFKSVTGRENFPAFGRGQWQENDEWVLLNDQYDVYRATPDGSEIKKLTNGADDKIRYRQQRVDTEEPYVEEGQPVYFSMYGDTTKSRGFARFSDNKLEELIYKPAMLNRLSKAKSAKKFAYQSQTATDSPDFFIVENNFSNPLALTNTNPQQDEYYWAGDELITFTNERGEQLQGRLIYPAEYEPGKKYPMITYIYERRSQTMHSYSMPTRESPYNFRRFSSEDYFVFQPDITYKLRDPGVSAVESVVPAVKKVLKTGMVDEEKLGLTGHSWGAYQTSFIITQTDLFNSAVAGAPLTNMISMYNSIYWNTGTPDATIFEISQGRFPDPYWKDWDNFIENSPLFQIQNTTTPLLVEFGTDDGAVDFNQGVELYNTMRRMEKPFVMLVYEGENHGLGRKENQIDYATRAFEWHEHFLLGKEPADWITEGLPYIERPEIKEKED